MNFSNIYYYILDEKTISLSIYIDILSIVVEQVFIT